MAVPISGDGEGSIIRTAKSVTCIRRRELGDYIFSRRRSTETARKYFSFLGDAKSIEILTEVDVTRRITENLFLVSNSLFVLKRI